MSKEKGRKRKRKLKFSSCNISLDNYLSETRSFRYQKGAN